jgi:hypothetical protein
VVKPLLVFLRATGAPFMVNAYPFYGLTDDTPLDFALFRVGATGVMDAGSGLLYTNALDAQLDAVHSAMDRMGFGDVVVVVAETGWPWAGEDWETGVGADHAGDYNKNAIRHLGSGVGTPLRPNRTFEVSIFSLFDEDLKPGPLSQRHFGLFHADMTPVYAAGILTAPEYVGPVSSKVTPAAAASVPAPAPDATAADSGGRRWCVPAPAADAAVLQENIDFVCGQGGIDCSAIRLGGSCYEPDTLQAHAAYAMNLYFRSNGDHEFDCEFGHTGVVTTADPSKTSSSFSKLMVSISPLLIVPLVTRTHVLFSHGRFWRLQFHIKARGRRTDASAGEEDLCLCLVFNMLLIQLCASTFQKKVCVNFLINDI